MTSHTGEDVDDAYWDGREGKGPGGTKHGTGDYDSEDGSEWADADAGQRGAWRVLL